MGFNDRMDDPEVYGAQYARDYYPSVSARTAVIDAEPDEEAEEEDCPHDDSRPAGDGFEECVDCGQTFFRIDSLDAVT